MEYIKNFTGENLSTTHLFDDDPVDVRVEGQHQQSRSDNGGKIEEDEVVVVHHLHEETLLVVIDIGVPAEKRQEAHYRPGHPAHGDDDCNGRGTLVIRVP